MADEPIILPQQVEPQVVEARAIGVEQPAPSAEQEQVADGLFTRDQEEAVAAVIGLQAAASMLHHLAHETFAQPRLEELQDPRRRRPRPESHND